MSSRRSRAHTDPIEKANQKSDQEFLSTYIQLTEGHAQWTTKWQHPKTGYEYGLVLVRAEAMTDPDLTSCLDMIDLTSGQDYRNSSMGWNRDAKLAEMKSPGLRYILVRDDGGAMAAFTSFMPTYEEGQPVLYCYEIHLLDRVRKSGLGRLLMGYLCNIAATLPPITKVMLTCFTSNEGARAFYEQMGFVTDDISPRPRVLRGGRETRAPDYVILSKVVDRLTSG
ncbi:hypothetical protein ACKVWC_005345 [Pyricularia oryzae]